MSRQLGNEATLSVTDGSHAAEVLSSDSGKKAGGLLSEKEAKYVKKAASPQEKTKKPP